MSLLQSPSLYSAMRQGSWLIAWFAPVTHASMLKNIVTSRHLISWMLPSSLMLIPLYQSWMICQDPAPCGGRVPFGAREGFFRKYTNSINCSYLFNVNSVTPNCVQILSIVYVNEAEGNCSYLTNPWQVTNCVIQCHQRVKEPLRRILEKIRKEVVWEHRTQ